MRMNLGEAIQPFEEWSVGPGSRVGSWVSFLTNFPMDTLELKGFLFHSLVISTFISWAPNT